MAGFVNLQGKLEPPILNTVSVMQDSTVLTLMSGFQV